MRWAVISFGGTSEQHACIPTFIRQLSNRCEHLGILLSKNTMVSTLFEHIQLLNNVTGLETKLRRINESANGNLQLLVCVMDRRHKGYGHLKRILDAFYFQKVKKSSFLLLAVKESGMYIIDSPTSSETRRGIPEGPFSRYLDFANSCSYH